MSKYLFPYYSNKKRAFFKQGKKRLVVTRISKYHFEGVGDKINKILNWNIFETVHADRIKLTYINKHF